MINATSRTVSQTSRLQLRTWLKWVLSLDSWVDWVKIDSNFKWSPTVRLSAAPGPGTRASRPISPHIFHNLLVTKLQQQNLTNLQDSGFLKIKLSLKFLFTNFQFPKFREPSQPTQPTPSSPTCSSISPFTRVSMLRQLLYNDVWSLFLVNKKHVSLLWNTLLFLSLFHALAGVHSFPFLTILVCKVMGLTICHFLRRCPTPISNASS